MLTADLVHASRRGDTLVLHRLRGAGRRRAVELAGALLQTAAGMVGSSRDELREAWRGIETLARERRLVDGLRKLVEDRCEFAMAHGLDPAALRREVFAKASESWKTVGAGRYFDRDRVLREVAAARDLEPAQVEHALYADLRGAHELVAAPADQPESLVLQYEQAQVQAVLLKAIRVTVDVQCRHPAAYRTLFAQLKFRRLLYCIKPLSEGYRLEIDGPLSLFESVTKYGLQLALAWPALQQCDHVKLSAEVRWGKRRSPLTFAHESRCPSCGSADGPELTEEIVALRRSFDELATPWKTAPAARILELPGVGLTVPDLVFTRPDFEHPIYFEVLGYWSREAVWRRVELVQQGLSERVLFAVSSHLRVSEDVLADEELGALYVYKRVMSARAIARRLDALAGR